MKTGIRVGDAMTRKLVICSPEENVISCVKKMLKNSVGGILVSEGEKIVGVITEKDITERIVGEKRDASKTTAREIMTRKVTSISPEKDLYEALVLMGDEGIRRLPVVSNKKLVGLLTEKDILKIQPTLFELVVESLNIREEDNKIREGANCEVCGTHGALFRVGDRWLCAGCK